MLVVTGLGARPAHAHIAPAGSQTMLMAGWETLLVDLDAAQPYVSRRFAVFVALHPEHPGPQDSLYRMTVTAVAGAGTIATPQRGHLVRSAGSPREWEGDIGVPTRGGWGLRFDLVTPKGTTASTMYPITVAAPNAIPVWQGWCMGLSPLVALLGFAVWQAGVLRRQLREEAADDCRLGQPSSAHPTS